jgi:hypothetical protein
VCHTFDDRQIGGEWKAGLNLLGDRAKIKIRGAYQGDRVAVQITTYSDNSLHRVEAILPFASFGIFTGDMFEEAECPARPQDSPDFGQHTRWIRNAAQCQARHDAIEAFVLERQVFAS